MPGLNRGADFVCVVLVQAVAFGVFAGIRGLRPAAIRNILAVSALFGLLFGVIFDLLFGSKAAVFKYQIEPDTTFTIANGTFSYGIAAATAALFPSVELQNRRQAPNYHAVLLFALSDLAGGMVILLLPGSPISTTFAAGILVLASGEMLLAICGWKGPILLLLSGRYQPFLRFWLATMIVGFIYEAANSFFPVWRWSLFDALPRWPAEALIVTSGYVVLFHPLVISWQLMREKPQ